MRLRTGKQCEIRTKNAKRAKTSVKPAHKAEGKPKISLMDGTCYVGERFKEAGYCKHNSFDVLTFNVAEFAPHSKAAYPFELAEIHSIMWFTTMIRDSLPTVFCLQEIPLKKTDAVLRCIRNMVNANLEQLEDPELRWEYKEVKCQTKSHCGYINIFVRSDIQVVKSTAVGPSVIVKIDMSHKKNKRFVYLASAHLAPHKEGQTRRKEQMKAVVDWIEDDQKVNPVGSEVCWVLAGDMNMRDAETASIKTVSSNGNVLSDAWEVSGKPAESRFTWDSKRNKYHRNCFEFLCRFDRIFTFPEIKPDRFHLVGDEPFHGTKDHFISDHYGLFVSLPKKEMFRSFIYDEHITNDEARSREKEKMEKYSMEEVRRLDWMKRTGKEMSRMDEMQWDRLRKYYKVVNNKEGFVVVRIKNDSSSEDKDEVDVAKKEEGQDEETAVLMSDSEIQNLI